MHAIADAVTQCKFEATDPAADEVVLYKILQVTHQCSKTLPCSSPAFLEHIGVGHQSSLTLISIDIGMYIGWIAWALLLIASMPRCQSTAVMLTA